MQKKVRVRLVVSNSELSDFRTCRKRWGLRYVDLLRPLVEARVLTWGRVFHSGIEAGYRASALGPGPEAKLGRAIVASAAVVAQACAEALLLLEGAAHEKLMGVDELEERLADIAKLERVATWATRHFFECTGSDFSRLVLLAVEWPFEVPMLNSLGHPSATRITGQVDAVWWDPKSRQVLVDDHKSTDGDATGTGVERRIQLDPQMSGYIAAVRWAAIQGELQPLEPSAPRLNPDDLARGARGWCRYNMVRRSMPHEPKVNQDGSVSVAAIDTDGATYEAALNDQLARGVPLKEKQVELLQRLAAQQDRYFSRHEFGRGPVDEALWRDEVFADARLMRQARRDPRMLTRNASACTMASSPPCSYRKLCLQDAPETRALFRTAETPHEEVRDGQEAEAK